jgi:hypothetical protein
MVEAAEHRNIHFVIARRTATTQSRNIRRGQASVRHSADFTQDIFLWIATALRASQ